MSFEARVLSVLIASPGDVGTARDTVEAAIRSWNSDNASRAKVVLLPLRWETDSTPQLGRGDAQTVINRQLVDDADIVIAVFHSRLGQPTARGASGTAEEIQQGVDRGVPTHVYFSDMPLPSNLDTDQLSQLREFKDSLQSKGLISSYSSDEDLKWKIRSALEADVADLVSNAVLGRPGDVAPHDPKAVIRVRLESSFSTPRQYVLVVENIGEAPADHVELDIEPIGDGDAPQSPMHLQAGRLQPQTAMNFPLVVTLSTALTWNVKYRWSDGGLPDMDEQSVSIF